MQHVFLHRNSLRALLTYSFEQMNQILKNMCSEKINENELRSKQTNQHAINERSIFINWDCTKKTSWNSEKKEDRVIYHTDTFLPLFISSIPLPTAIFPSHHITL